MALPQDDIMAMLHAHFPDSLITLDDTRGDNDHYALKVVSSAFEGKSRIEQHKMVYEALGGKMGKELHALSIQTMTPPSVMEK